jgi:hypothetical protein
MRDVLVTNAEGVNLHQSGFDVEVENARLIVGWAFHAASFVPLLGSG